MKKLLMLFVILSFGIGFSPSDALAKKNSRNRSTKKINYDRLVYEGVWFSRLSDKQQTKYLQTIKKLTMKLKTRGIAGFDSSYIQYLIPHLDAANRINNGFIFDGQNDDADYDAFLVELDILGGPLDPKCTAPDQLCAPYLGMDCSGGTGKLVCSPDNTSTCAARGKLDCLKTTLANCGMNADGSKRSAGSVPSREFCKKLDRTMARGTQNVKGHCSSGSRSAAQYCKDAIASLEGEEVPPSPSDTTAPTGADCEQMVRELVKTKDKNRDRGETPETAETGVSNHDFWINMTGFAQQACGHSTVLSNSKGNGTMDIVGSCPPRSIDTGKSAVGNPSRTEVKTYSRNDRKNFNTCIKVKKEAATASSNRIMAKEKKRLSGAALDKRIQELGTSLTKLIDSLDRRSECTTTEKTALLDADGNTRQELELSTLLGLAPKIRSNTDLTPEEEKKFRAATGLSSSSFRAAFCNSTNFLNFKRALQSALTSNAKVSGTDSISKLLRGQMEVARYKTSACLKALRPVDGKDGTGCKLHKVNDENLLRCASAGAPILAQKRGSNQCVLVTGFNRRVTSKDNDGNSTGRKVTLNVRTPAGTSEVTTTSESVFAKEHKLRVYRCEGDRAQNRSCYMVPKSEDPRHEGESESAI